MCAAVPCFVYMTQLCCCSQLLCRIGMLCAVHSYAFKAAAERWCMQDNAHAAMLVCIPLAGAQSRIHMMCAVIRRVHTMV
jgi:hypothetical protein